MALTRKQIQEEMDKIIKTPNEPLITSLQFEKLNFIVNKLTCSTEEAWQKAREFRKELLIRDVHFINKMVEINRKYRDYPSDN